MINMYHRYAKYISKTKWSKLIIISCILQCNQIWIYILLQLEIGLLWFTNRTEELGDSTVLILFPYLYSYHCNKTWFGLKKIKYNQTHCVILWNFFLNFDLKNVFQERRICYFNTCLDSMSDGCKLNNREENTLCLTKKMFNNCFN